MKRFLQKLKTKSGFTLVEMLTVMVILLLVSGVVAAGMPVAANAYTKVVDSGNAQVLLSTVKTALREELSTATDIEPETGGPLTYYRSARYAVFAQLSCNADTKVIDLKYFSRQKNDSGVYVYSSYGEEYDRPLVSTAAATGLTVKYDSIVYDKANQLFKVYGLAVKKGSAVLAGKEDPEQEGEPFVIRILNP